MSGTHTFVSRRQFCAGACQIASCATLATFVSGCGDGSPTGPSGGGASKLPSLSGQFANSRVQVNTAGTALADVGGAAVVESVAGVFLISRTSASSVTAIDAVCTHEGCTVNTATADQYVCPCHGSRYDRSGHLVAGPAKASLRQYAATLADGVVTIAL